MFPSVLALIEDNIAKDGSTSTRGISEKEQLMVTLRYLAEGESHKTLSLYFMIGQPTISKCIPKVMTIGHCTWGLFTQRYRRLKVNGLKWSDDSRIVGIM